MKSILAFLRVCVIAWLTWWGQCAHAVEVLRGPEVEAQGTHAMVRWTTDVDCGATVRFGLTPDALRRSSTGKVGREHTVRLDNLEPGRSYHYSIGTARRVLKTGQFVAASTTPAPAAKPGLLERLLPKRQSPPARETAAPPAHRTWRNVATLRDHFERHGRDFGAKDAEDYAAQAWHFLRRAIAEKLPAKYDPEGTLRIWDPKTRAFAAYGLDGRTKTYFKPESPSYFQRQPGRLVQLSSATPVPR